mmetsp:Transcript_34548/g.89557  ORF Transcript_34548/g.89557 Transcript_34548/m.89557 type:complete len:1354 (-) Transcript_34548:358-4419(-)
MPNKGTKSNGRVHPAEQTSMSAHDSSTASDSHHDGGGDIMQASEALLKEGLSKSKGVHWWWLTFGEPAIEAEYRKFRRLRGHVTHRATSVAIVLLSVLLAVADQYEDAAVSRSVVFPRTLVVLGYAALFVLSFARPYREKERLFEGVSITLSLFLYLGFIVMNNRFAFAAFGGGDSNDTCLGVSTKMVKYLKYVSAQEEEDGFVNATALIAASPIDLDVSNGGVLPFARPTHVLSGHYIYWVMGNVTLSDDRAGDNGIVTNAFCGLCVFFFMNMRAPVAFFVSMAGFLVTVFLSAGLCMHFTSLPVIVPVMGSFTMIWVTVAFLVMLTWAAYGGEKTARQAFLSTYLRREAVMDMVNVRERRRENEVKEEFLANLSHELRTPIHGIIAMTEMMLDEKEMTAETRENALIIKKCTDNLLYLINDILLVSKMDANKFELERSPANIADMVEGVVYSLAPMAHKRMLDVHLYVDPLLPATVFIDVDRLRQVVTNLMSNAIKFSSTSGSVAVSVVGKRAKHSDLRRMTADEKNTAASGSLTEPLEVVIAVRDQGVGINPKNKGKLFTRFGQLGASRKGGAKIAGTGLGLVISRSICQMLDGEIVVESEEGKGSLFLASVFGLADVSSVERMNGLEWTVFDPARPFSSLSSRNTISLSGVDTHFRSIVKPEQHEAEVVFATTSPERARVFESYLCSESIAVAVWTEASEVTLDDSTLAKQLVHSAYVRRHEWGGESGEGLPLDIVFDFSSVVSKVAADVRLHTPNGRASYAKALLRDSGNGTSSSSVIPLSHPAGAHSMMLKSGGGAEKGVESAAFTLAVQRVLQQLEDFTLKLKQAIADESVFSSSPCPLRVTLFPLVRIASAESVMLKENIPQISAVGFDSGLPILEVRMVKVPLLRGTMELARALAKPEGGGGGGDGGVSRTRSHVWRSKRRNMTEKMHASHTSSMDLSNNGAIPPINVIGGGGGGEENGSHGDARQLLDALDNPQNQLAYGKPLLPPSVLDSSSEIPDVDGEEEGLELERMVLCVDDDEMCAAVTRRQVEQCSSLFRAVAETKPIRALDMLKEVIGSEGPPPLIIVDGQMPDMSGQDFIRRVRQMETEAEAKPSVMFALTGQAEEEDGSFLCAGADKVLHKPLRMAEMKKALSPIQPELKKGDSKVEAVNTSLHPSSTLPVLNESKREGSSAMEVWTSSKQERQREGEVEVKVKVDEEREVKKGEGDAHSATRLPPPLSLLVVDDDMLCQVTAKKIIQKHKLASSITIAANGQEAIEVLSDTDEGQPRFDAILMDCQMPVMDGIECTRRIRKMDGKFGSLPIIATTAGADWEVCKDAGMNALLKKPFSAAQLRSCLAEHLNGRL